MYKKLLSIALALILVLSMALTGCAGKTTDTESNVEEPTTETSTGDGTANAEEDVAKLVNDFYAGLADSDPIRMDFLSEGELISTFIREGDKIASMYSNTDGDYGYYGFIEDGVKYYIDDGVTAYANDTMYDMINEGIPTSLQMFVTGIFSDDAESTDTDAEYTYSAEQTDSQLTYNVDAVIGGVAEKMTVTGTKDTDGRVTDIAIAHTIGDDPTNMELRFSYDNITVELPEYTIGIIDEPALVGETSHVDSPYTTLQELIDTLDEEEHLMYVVQEDYVYAIGEKDGRYYQFSASIPDEAQSEYDALDVMEDDYDSKLYAILGALTIDDCIDFTDCVETPEELASYEGMTVGEMIEAGFENSGWGIGDDQGNVFISKNLVNYSAVITIPENFDADSVDEFEDLYDCVIESVKFDELESIAMPIE